jgi:hypothetical protein
MAPHLPSLLQLGDTRLQSLHAVKHGKHILGDPVAREGPARCEVAQMLLNSLVRPSCATDGTPELAGQHPLVERLQSLRKPHAEEG